MTEAIQNLPDDISIEVSIPASESHDQKFVHKKTYAKWVCKDCANSFYYQVAKCPLCESLRVEMHVFITSYGVMQLERR